MHHAAKRVRALLGHVGRGTSGDGDTAGSLTQLSSVTRRRPQCVRFVLYPVSVKTPSTSCRASFARNERTFPCQTAPRMDADVVVAVLLFVDVSHG